MMTELLDDLDQHQAICRELLGVAQAEGLALRHHEYPGGAAKFDQSRKALLPALARSVDQLKQHRLRWQKLPSPERARHPEIAAQLRQTQDALMKILTLDRENEQLFLRQGLLPPTHLPSLNRQRPHFVANLYARQGRPRGEMD
jgi:flagellar biosynthesis/type III secretory pathway chaperone